MTIRDAAERPQISALEGAKIVYFGTRGTRAGPGGEAGERPLAPPSTVSPDRLRGAAGSRPGARSHARARANAAAIQVPKSDELAIWGLCGAAFMSLAVTWAL